MALTTTQINQLYVSYFGRPADVAGIQYYQSVNATPNQVAAAFAASAESQALFGNLSTNAQINAIYQNLFNRDAESAGLTYWSQQVSNGSLSLAAVALAIGNGAQNADRTAIENKVVIANSFVAALDTSAEIVGYTGDAAAASARSFIKGIGSSTVITTAQSQVDAAVAAAVNVGGTVGNTVALTTGLDALTGTSNNDTFIANAATIQAGDTINGGAGNDTFVYAGADATFTLPTLQNIENLQFNAPTAALTIDARSLSGVTGVTVNVPVTGTSIQTGSGQSATFSGTGSTTVAAATVVNSGASVNVGVNAGITVTTLTVTDTALTTLNLASNGAANTITTLTTTPAAASSLNVYGTSKLTIGAIDTNFTTVNASATTGGVDLTFGANVVTVTGGSGNDRFAFGANLTAADKVDGGAGNDIIAVTGADFTTASNAQLAGLNAVTNIETLEFTGTAATTIAGGTTATSFTNAAVNKILFNTTGTNLDTVNAAGSARTYAFGALNEGDATLNLGASVASVNVALEGGTTAAGGTATVGTLTVAPLAADLTATPSLVNTVNIASSGVSGVGANTIAAVTAQAGSTIKVTGSNDLTITAVTNKAIVDASSFTGKLVVTGSTAADVITLGSAADTVNVQASGSTYAAIDTINGFAKADTLVLAGTTVNATATTFVKADVSAALSFEQALATAEAAVGGSAGSTNAAWFNYGGNTYVLGNTDNTKSASDAGSTDLVVKITGVVTLTADATGIHGA